ncbi:hypothetical protein [Pseudomonas sp. P7548]|uniref:hypothetical protein n=1 Tax=Pseudomonas sp. P7548 TaxID=2726981 RepID=UPI0015B8BFEA|nr:hypothetical protein [Pseudomonas sp. P7548]NWE20414.1 hypothetical protein [Pseudomonas sp. P7548]
MIDSITGQKIFLIEHPTYGPYVRVSSYEDSMDLEDLLDDKYYVPYWIGKPKDLQFLGGAEYYFGPVVDVEKLQAILDLIDSDYRELK